jgi:hypothetical protein
MGAPKIPKPQKPPAPPDTAKAQLNALAYAELERRIRSSQGRAGTFLTGKTSFAPALTGKALLGQ